MLSALLEIEYREDWMNKTLYAIALLACLMVMTASGCFPGGDTYSASDPAGFFSGIWHGWIAPISLIVGIFESGIRIYEPFNTGWWYDLGFYIAVIAGFGGLAFSRRKKEKQHIG